MSCLLGLGLLGRDATHVTSPRVGRAEGDAARLGPYRIDDAIGRGGMGEVLLVHDPRLDRAVAAKTAHGKAQSDALLRQKFLTEAKLTGRLEHPNIVPVHDMGSTQDGRLYFTMKRVQGQNLQEWLDSPAAGEVPGRESALPHRLGVFLKICDAMGFAHSQGVIHRDLKPANIMIGQFGEVLVMDWGLAKVIDQEGPLANALRATSEGAADGPGAPLTTQLGTVLGTPAYMPPEQARGEIEKLDARSDIYSLGAILYQMLTGRPPYSGSSATDVMAKVKAGQLRAPSSVSERKLPWELEAVVTKAMAHSPRDRYVSVEALASDIGHYLEGHRLLAARYRPWQMLYKWIGRNRLLSFATLVSVALLVGWAIYQLGQRRSFSTLREQAQRAHDEQDWPGALLSARLALRIREDPALRALFDDCRERIAKTAQYRRLQGELAPLARQVDHVKAQLYLSWIDFEAKQRDLLAAQTRLEALAREPAHRRHAELWLLLGRCQYLAQRYPAAEKSLRRALELAPRDEAARFFLARVYLHRGMASALVSSFMTLSRRWVRQASELLEQPLDRGRWPHQQLLSDALAAWLSNDFARMYVICSEGIQKHGRSLAAEELWVLRAMTRSGRERLADLNQAITRRPYLGWLYVARGGYHYNARQFRRAREDVNTALKRSRTLPYAYILRAKMHHRPEAMIADYSRAIELRPAAVEPWVERAKCWLMLERCERAAADLEHALTLGTEQAHFVYFLRSLMRAFVLPASQRDWPGALKDLDRMIAAKPRIAGNHALRSVYLARMGDHQGARAERAIARRLAPDLSVEILVAYQLRRLGRIEEAIALLRKSVSASPKSVSTWEMLAGLEQRLHHWTLAIEACERALALSRERGDQQAVARARLRLHEILASRATERQERGDAAGAVADLTQAMTHRPNQAEDLLNRGNAYRRLRQDEAALRDFSRAIQLAPDWDAPRFNRGMLWMRRRAWKRATADFDHILTLNPRDADAYHLRGLVKHQTASWTGAIDDFTRALRYAPGDFRCLVYRGEALARVGRRQEALRDLRQACAMAARDPKIAARHGKLLRSAKGMLDSLTGRK